MNSGRLLLFVSLMRHFNRGLHLFKHLSFDCTAKTEYISLKTCLYTADNRSKKKGTTSHVIFLMLKNNN